MYLYILITPKAASFAVRRRRTTDLTEAPHRHLQRSHQERESKNIQAGDSYEAHGLGAWVARRTRADDATAYGVNHRGDAGLRETGRGGGPPWHRRGGAGAKRARRCAMCRTVGAVRL